MAKSRFRMHRCRMAGVEAVEADSGHSFPLHTHEQYGIGVMESGAQKSASGRGLVEAGPGDVITVNPGEVHDGIPIGDAGRSWRMLYLDPEVAAGAIADITEGRASEFEFSLPVISDHPPAMLFRRLFQAVTEGEQDGLEMRRDEMLLMLLAQARGTTSARPALPQSIAAARELIDSDPVAPLTLAHLGEASGLSRFQVVRGFAKATGMTPHAYLMQRRVHLARRLIAQGTALADTAAASGFADQSHMTRHFVRAFGLSPGAYAAVAV